MCQGAGVSGVEFDNTAISEGNTTRSVMDGFGKGEDEVWYCGGMRITVAGTAKTGGSLCDMKGVTW